MLMLIFQIYKGFLSMTGYIITALMLIGGVLLILLAIRMYERRTRWVPLLKLAPNGQEYIQHSYNTENTVFRVLYIFYTQCNILITSYIRLFPPTSSEESPSVKTEDSRNLFVGMSEAYQNKSSLASYQQHITVWLFFFKPVGKINYFVKDPIEIEFSFFIVYFYPLMFFCSYYVHLTSIWW